MRNFISNSIRAAGLAGLLYIAGCGNPEVRPTQNPYSEIRRISYYHGGVKERKDDKDFDRDGKLDDYAVMRDGTIYAIYSSDLINQIIDGVKKPNWVWRKVSP